MPKTIIKIKTWTCSCGYTQDIEPTAENMLAIFGYTDSACPSCSHELLSRETREEKKCTVTIPGEEEVETMEVDDTSKPKDAEGKLPKRKLVKAEKDAHIQKIRDDVVKFQAMECEL